MRVRRYAAMQDSGYRASVAALIAATSPGVKSVRVAGRGRVVDDGVSPAASDDVHAARAGMQKCLDTPEGRGHVGPPDIGNAERAVPVSARVALTGTDGSQDCLTGGSAGNSIGLRWYGKRSGPGALARSGCITASIWPRSLFKSSGLAQMVPWR